MATRTMATRTKKMGKAKPKTGTRKSSSAGARAVRSAPAKKSAAKAVVQSRKQQWVYAFGSGRAQRGAQMRNLLGGKGAGLAEMAGLGLPVPPGVTITTEVCTH